MKNKMTGVKDLTRDDIVNDLVVIKINKTYREGMSAEELYDYTRGIWRRKIKSVSAADFALSVVNGIVIEVYEIDTWIPATEAIFKTRTCDPERCAKRIAFEGRVAKESVRKHYIGKSVANLYKYGEANPVKLFLKNSSL